jgi:Rod binding domain-containing protein
MTEIINNLANKVKIDSTGNAERGDKNAGRIKNNTAYKTADKTDNANTSAHITSAEMTDIKLVASKFESIFLNILFDSMSKENGGGTFINHGSAYKIFNSMLYQSIANDESYGRGIGIARMIVNYFKDNPSLIKNSLNISKLKSETSDLTSSNDFMQAVNASDKYLGNANILNNYKKLSVLNNRADGGENAGNISDNLANSASGYASGEYTSIDSLAKAASKTYGLPYNLIKAVIKTESGFNPNAISSKGAVGLMQVMPQTAEEMGIADVSNPVANVFCGSLYLKKMLDRNKGNIELALAAYNSGQGNVDKYGGIPPFAETQNYVKKVLNYYNQYNDDSQPPAA